MASSASLLSFSTENSTSLPGPRKDAFKSRTWEHSDPPSPFQVIFSIKALGNQMYPNPKEVMYSTKLMQVLSRAIVVFSFGLKS